MKEERSLLIGHCQPRTLIFPPQLKKWLPAQHLSVWSLVFTGLDRRRKNEQDHGLASWKPFPPALQVEPQPHTTDCSLVQDPPSSSSRTCCLLSCRPLNKRGRRVWLGASWETSLINHPWAREQKEKQYCLWQEGKSCEDLWGGNEWPDTGQLRKAQTLVKSWLCGSWYRSQALRDKPGKKFISCNAFDLLVGLQQV